MQNIKVTVTVEVEGISPSDNQMRTVTRRMVHERTVSDYDMFTRMLGGMAGTEVPAMLDEGIQEFLTKPVAVLQAENTADADTPADAPTDAPTDT